jgi:hypothetical protein
MNLPVHLRKSWIFLKLRALKILLMTLMQKLSRTILERKINQLTKKEFQSTKKGAPQKSIDVDVVNGGVPREIL